MINTPMCFSCHGKEDTQNTLNTINLEINKVLLEQSQTKVIYTVSQLRNKNNVKDKAKKEHCFAFKMKIKQASNRCEMVLEAAKLLVLIKHKKLSLSRKLTVATFGELLITFSTKVNLLYSLYLTTLRYCFLHKAKLFAENFS